MENQDPTPESEAPDQDDIFVTTPLFVFGITNEGRVGWALDDEGIARVMRASTEHNRLVAVEMAEQAMIKFLSVMCGGSQ